MPDVTLTAEPRTETGIRPAGRLRREGQVPAVVYGLGTDTLSVTVPARELQHILSRRAAGANTADHARRSTATTQLTLARQIQRHPVQGRRWCTSTSSASAPTSAVSAEVPLTSTARPKA